MWISLVTLLRVAAVGKTKALRVLCLVRIKSGLLTINSYKGSSALETNPYKRGHIDHFFRGFARLVASNETVGDDSTHVGYVANSARNSMTLHCGITLALNVR